MEEWPSTVRRSVVKFIEKPFGKSLKLTFSLLCSSAYIRWEKVLHTVPSTVCMCEKDCVRGCVKGTKPKGTVYEAFYCIGYDFLFLLTVFENLRNCNEQKQYY